MKKKGDRSCLYSAIASHIITFCVNEVWNNRFPPWKKYGTIQATFKMVNDLKEIVSNGENEITRNVFGIDADQEVNDFIREMIEE